jgi:hypothetical protein
LLKTPFGFKRARWVQHEIEKGFAIPVPLLNTSMDGGSLFSNATYFMGRIAFRNEPDALRILEAGATSLPPELRSYPFSGLRGTRLEEIVGSTVIRTDFVPFIQAGVGSNSHLLIYSFLEQGEPKLITAFPVAQGFVDRALSPKDLGENQPIMTRYNAYIEGLTGKIHHGTRRVTSWTSH